MNYFGRKWTQGGAKSRTSKGLGYNGGNFSIDFSNFEYIAERLESLDVDLRDAVGEAINEAASQVQEDTLDAVQPPNLPAKGRFSQGQTEASVIENPQVEWSGLIGEVELGFDKDKPGAGGFLITGTPKMQPAPKLAKIYTTAKYLSDFKKKIQEALNEVIERNLK